jgi:mannose-6-phosphate isomerase
MPSIFKLDNTVKRYDWGSPEWIPRLLGLPPDRETPWAELWMGVHPQGPSALAPSPGAPPPGAPRLLSDLIAEDPPRLLGEEVAKDFGGLPFLFKLLAAERPLSIQAHPDADQARSGWERENSRGIPADAPDRNYQDPNHKPEIICALGPFVALAGFREPGEIRSLLRLFGCPALAPLLDALEAPPGTGGEGARAGPAPLKRFLSALFSLDRESRRALGAHARAFLRNAPGDYGEEWRLAARFAELYPEDPAVIAPLYLNLISLQAGEAMNIPAGILHAYVRGFGVELMANSDNVLRGGLTPKHIDADELTAILRFAPCRPTVLKPVDQGGGLAAYPSPFREFSLYRLRGDGVEAPFPLRGPAILLVLEGELRAENLRLSRGESAFVVSGPLLSGSFEAAVAAAGAAYSARL